MVLSILPLSYRKGRNYWHIYTSAGVKLCTINLSMARQEEIAKMIVEAVNDKSK